MEALRNAATNNRSTIMNLVYIAAFLAVLYYLYKFLIAGSDLEVTLLNTEVPANEPMTYALPTKNPDVRVKPGGEYTISFWMYVTSWDYRAGLAKSVLQILDTKATNYSLLTTALYPNENRLMVRVHTEAANQGVDYTLNSAYDNLMSGKQGMANEVIESPMCDIQDIDLQRWINITISVNGRIVDVYYDGKLNRSCVLPDIPMAPESGIQVVATGKKGGFGGKISAVQFFAYPLTPDRIYAIYQAGPKGPSGFIGFLAEKLGIKLTYSGKDGAQQAMSV